MLVKQVQQRVRNYFKPYQNLANPDINIRLEDRDIYAQRIYDLWLEKDYRHETLFLAINIFDRILSRNLKEVESQDLILYAVTSLLLAAKQEQPLSPSIGRMVKLLDSHEQLTASKTAIIAFEEQVINMLDFDFYLVSPL